MALEEQTPPFIRMRGVSKFYAGVRAIEDIDLDCRQGTIHAILGENGAGKSTLIKVMSGVVRPDAGTLTVAGAAMTFARPSDAVAAGIVSVFQELSLMPDLTVAENISISDPPRRGGLIDRRAQTLRAEGLLARIGCEDIDPRSLVRELSLSRRQMVEIAKALGKNPRLLILDEATSALTSRDVETVYHLLADLKRDGIGMLFISHRMHEVETLCDTLSVFRNGRHIETFAKGTHDQDAIVKLMIGRDIVHQFPARRPVSTHTPHLVVRNLKWEEQLHDVSLEVGKGEIVGLGGLDGQGQKELLLALFGVLRDVGGTVTIDGHPASPADPAAAKGGTNRIALVPEDRKTEGLMLPMSVADNLLAASFDRVVTGPFIDAEKARKAVAEAIAKLQIKVARTDDPVSTLSGGNQQKVVLAKWLMTDPGLVLLNDPTRGIDVGTKQELYHLMRNLADQGTAILFYSTDYAELIGLCDRVVVMYGGRIVSEFSGAEITEEKLVSAALNIAAGGASKAGNAAGAAAAGTAQPASPRSPRKSAVAISLSQNRGFYAAILLFAALYIPYNFLHPRGFTISVLVANANETLVLCFVAVAQALAVLTGGLDLSVGAVMTLTTTIASWVVAGSPTQIFFGCVLTVLVGTAFGLANGLVIVYGRLQPIIATLASGAVALGLGLLLRPIPGGEVDADLSWAASNSLRDAAETYGLFDGGEAAWFQPIAWFPMPLLILIVVVGVVWVPFRRTVTGRTLYAIGSSEGGAYMSGLPINRSRLTAYTLGGLFAGCAGLYLAIQTGVGAANIPQTGVYTLNSIAAVVLGGISLVGGVGSVVGAIFGAIILRIISFYFRVLSIDPLLQTLVEGIVLLAAVSLGTLYTLRVKNRLELFR